MLKNLTQGRIKLAASDKESWFNQDVFLNENDQRNTKRKIHVHHIKRFKLSVEHFTLEKI